MVRKLSLTQRIPGQVQGLGPCEHRSVARDGRVVCAKIVEGDNQVSPRLCGACPFKAVNCAHLRFSLRRISPSPLVVRYNGRTEIWDDDPPELRFEQAACALQAVPITDARQCAGCALRQSLEAPEPRPMPRRRQAVGQGKVVPFPSQPALAAG